MVKVPNSRKLTTKGKTLSWDLNEGSQRSKNLKENASIVGRNKPKEANVIDNITNDVSGIDLIAVISEVNLVGLNFKEWWNDIGATSHVCSDKKMFSTFDPIKTRDKVCDAPKPGCPLTTRQPAEILVDVG